MVHAVPPRSEVNAEYTWDIESVYPTPQAWEEAFQEVLDLLREADRFRGRLGNGPDVLADWLDLAEAIGTRLARVVLYASMAHNVDTSDQGETARYDRALGLAGRVAAGTSFAEPEMLAVGFETLRRWGEENNRLAVYQHYFDRMERRKDHIRSADVEEVLGLVRDPFSTASSIHRVLADTDLKFQPARTSGGDAIEVAQGNINALLTDADREVRRTAWESYADAHLAVKNTMASCIAAGVKQDVFTARARRYTSSLEAALAPNNIPTDVFHTLVDTYRRNLPIWHRYWSLRRRALGYETLYAYDVKAPLTVHPPTVPYQQAVEWIVDGMRPLGEEYVDVLRRGVLEQRWVDVYPNQGKTSGAYSSGAPGTHPFILMSYNDDVFSMSTLAHELGHSLHSYYTRRTQPFVYIRYGTFLAEVASNFNQAMVRAHLMRTNSDPDFQIALIEEAMSNFHRYFFIMPALARFELEVHERAERGEGLTADGLIHLMADLFQEGYGDEVEVDTDRVGITWAQFSHHLYMNFYVFQYATGISAAHALAHGVLEEGQPAAERYLDFLRAGSSLYPMDALQMAGVDMTAAEPVQRAFDVMGSMVDRLEQLVEGRSPVSSEP